MKDNGVNTDRTALALGILTAVCMVFALLISATEYMAYGDYNYYLREYERYEVLRDLPEMTLSDEDGLMAVTHHMMKYLRGDSDTPELQIEVRMGGERRGFFSERELLHMADVKGLFITALRLRNICFFSAMLLTLIAFLRRKDLKSFKKSTGAGWLIGFVLTAAAFAVLAVLAYKNFNTVFIEFHHIFFDNDYWLLDPRYDMLINIVPEGFFYDTAMRILWLFGMGMFSMIFVSCRLYKSRQ